LAVAVCAVAAGCGAETRSDETQVRDALDRFEQATDDRDYAALCDEVLATALVTKLGTLGLSCQDALRAGLGGVTAPKLEVLQVRVARDSALARVRTTAAGQAPSTDIVRLVRQKDGWRIASLAGAQPPSPRDLPAE
jgi:hypothetical protein